MNQPRKRCQPCLRGKPRIQSRTNEDHDGRGQEDNSIVATQAEAARAAGKHASAQGIDNIGQRIQMGNDFQPARHDGGGINCVARKEQRHGEHLAYSHEAFARLHNARDDERKRREQRGGKIGRASCRERVLRLV